MIKTLKIENFQSIKKGDFELGKFTALVGKTSSGKSAVLRAIVALASNERGSKSITLGTTHYSISACTDTDATVTLKKAKQTSYSVNGKEFDALNGKVPEEVSQILGVAPLSEGRNVNFAFQYDPPDPLKSTPGEVAKVLGELTGINKIFVAVGKANQKKKSLNALIKTRQSDLEKVVKQLFHYETLRDEIVLLQSLETEYAAIKDKQKSLSDLTSLVNRLEELSSRLETVKKLKAPPSLDRLQDLHARLNAYKADISRLTAKSAALSGVKSEIVVRKEIWEKSKAELTELIKELGYCPTCDRRYNG